MIVVSGSLAYDRIMDFPGRFAEHILPDKIHQLNVSFLVDNLRVGFGGTAGNIAYSLSLLGIKCGILGMAGGNFGEYREFLKRNEIETKYIKIIAKFETSTAFGITDSGDNQIWGYYMGADSMSDMLSSSMINEKKDFAIIAPQNPKTMLKLASEYNKEGTEYLFDPGMQLPWLDGDDLRTGITSAKIIIGNDYEVARIESKLNINSLHEQYKDKIVITTLGEKGSRISFKDEKVEVKNAIPKNTSDPAGAGDAFRSGFVAGYIRKYPIRVCGQMGSVAAVYTVEKFGTTTHKYSVSEFEARYKTNFGESLKL